MLPPTPKLRVLDLCSGIGGFTLGFQRTGGMETVAFCEIEQHPRRVLAKHWPDIPCHSDVRELRGEDVGSVEVICGGYPCQPFSKVGKRRGDKDPRHLWPEFSRLISELRPSWFIGENVANHVNVGIDEVLSDLEGKNYSVRAFLIPACGVDAPHKRERCWIIASNNDANSDSQRPHRKSFDKLGNHEPYDGKVSKSGQVCEILAQPRSASVSHPGPCGGLGFRRWPPEPRVGRMAHGVSSRVDRIKGLGNAVTPNIPEAIGHAILTVETRTS